MPALLFAALVFAVVPRAQGYVRPFSSFRRPTLVRSHVRASLHDENFQKPSWSPFAQIRRKLDSGPDLPLGANPSDIHLCVPHARLISHRDGRLWGTSSLTRAQVRLHIEGRESSCCVSAGERVWGSAADATVVLNSDRGVIIDIKVAEKFELVKGSQDKHLARSYMERFLVKLYPDCSHSQEVIYERNDFAFPLFERPSAADMYYDGQASVYPPGRMGRVGEVEKTLYGPIQWYGQMASYSERFRDHQQSESRREVFELDHAEMVP